jgi:folate-binding protein YgfZ
MNDSIPTQTGNRDAQEATEAMLSMTPLAQMLSKDRLQVASYRGAQTVRVFSNAPEELTHLLCAAGVYDLGWRGFLRCSGRDRARWLNGMVTNSIKGLEPNSSCYAFVLNAQGRIQGDLDIFRLGETSKEFWLQTDRLQMGPLSAFLRRYIIMDQVVLEPYDAWTAIGLAGPRAAEILSSFGFTDTELQPMRVQEISWKSHSLVIAAAYSPGVPRFEIWAAPEIVLEIWNMLVSAGAQPCGIEAVDQLRILEGVPTFGIDIADRDLPQETNQMRALNFNKGCYLGQEIVERIRSRGNVHRIISGFLLEQAGPLAGTEVLAEGKSVGNLTSVASIVVPGVGERVLALGHIRRETLEAKLPLTAAGVALTSQPLPLPFVCP